MNRKHGMPFGSECREDGTVRFRLWAPDAGSARVVLDGAVAELTMSAIGDGWFELFTKEAAAGTPYKFKVDDEQPVPDPASRYQPTGVHGPSEVIDPTTFEWQDTNWRGRPWDEAVIYEMHVGSFTPEGTFAGAEQKLEYLAGLGVTAIELMPVSSFPGKRNWGYDGVLPYAPAAAYGRPDDLKRFINAAHLQKLMVLLDVVYNHFGPEGNYLGLYAPQFFTDRHRTPWGRGINFDGACSRTVRDYFVHNALYWLEEYYFDGLRLDAVDAIKDDSHPDILIEIAETVRSRVAADRHIHLVLENDNNAAHYLRRDEHGKPRLYTAQWADDIHHALHVLVTGEKDGYYADYADRPAWHLGRCLAEGFSYQGDRSAYRNGQKRGEPSRELPPTGFVSFLQNHDQVGNRAFGERITQLAPPQALRAAMTCLLLAPLPPLLFMGEEFGASTPFLFFCDFGRELASKVTDGRRSEFARFARFSSLEARVSIPDPNEEGTFLACKLDWSSLAKPQHRAWLDFYRELLACRHAQIVPRIARIAHCRASYEFMGDKAIAVYWPFMDKGGLRLIGNFSDAEIRITKGFQGRLLYSSPPGWDPKTPSLPAFSVAWLLQE